MEQWARYVEARNQVTDRMRSEEEGPG